MCSRRWAGGLAQSIQRPDPTEGPKRGLRGLPDAFIVDYARRLGNRANRETGPEVRTRGSRAAGVSRPVVVGEPPAGPRLPPALSPTRLSLLGRPVRHWLPGRIRRLL